MTSKEQADVMLAYVAGSPIEYRTIACVVWRNAITPCWNWSTYVYRDAKKEITEGMTGLTVGGHQFHVWKKFDDRWRGVVSNDRHYANVTWTDDGQSKVYPAYSIPL